MAYVINAFDGRVLVSVDDGTTDQTLDLKLVGKNYPGYGEIQNENFVYLLENFARNVEPPSAIRGQLWYDTENKKLKVYTGDQNVGIKVWKSATGVDYGTEPSSPTAGDMWFDTSISQLKIRTGSNVNGSWLVIGPQNVGTNVTNMVSKTLKGTDPQTQVVGLYDVIAATVNGVVVYLISNTEFNIDPTDIPSQISGFSHIRTGLTLPYVSEDSGKSTTDHIYWGTASDANSLGGIPASEYSLKNNAIFPHVVDFSDEGYRLGNSQDLQVYIDHTFNPITGEATPTIRNVTGKNIVFKVKADDNTVKNPLNLWHDSIRPGVDGVYSLGTSSYKWSTVYASIFNGIATQADTLNLGGNYVVSSTSATNNTIAGRDGSGDLTANIFHGVATSARYADLAEKYLTDLEYEVGTVIMVGGDKEVTASKYGSRAIGVISENPAYMMNSELEGGQYIALKGRVSVKVDGPVNKNDELIAGNDGYAIANHENSYKVFAIALETNTDEGIKIIEAVIL